MNMFMLIDPERIIEDMHRPAVQKGAAWLDEYEPGWVNKIVPEELDLLSTDMCICGQMFGTYSERPSFVAEAEDFGFQHRPEPFDLFRSCYYWPQDMDLQRLVYNTLDGLWLDEIFWRKHPQWLVDAIGF